MLNLVIAAGIKYSELSAKRLEADAPEELFRGGFA
jgi:hypothetical protein